MFQYFLQLLETIITASAVKADDFRWKWRETTSA